MIKFRENYIYTMKFMEEIKSGNFTLEEDVLNFRKIFVGRKKRKKMAFTSEKIFKKLIRLYLH